MLGFLSTEIGSRSNGKETLAIPSMIKTQTSCHESINALEDKTFNNLHPLTYFVSTANEDMLCFNEAMKADDSTPFKEEMAKEIKKIQRREYFQVGATMRQTQR